ncbi:Cytochrome P450 86A7 [Linum grandiflorum]
MEPLGDGIFNADGKSWKIQREMIHALISTSKFEQLMLKSLGRKLDNALIPILHNACSSPNQVGEQKTLDLQDLMKRFTFDIICLLKWIGIGVEAKTNKASELFGRFLDDRIKVKKDQEQGTFYDDKDKEDDFLTQLISETQRIGESDVFLKDATFNLIVAGRDTIAAALSWFFWLVAINPIVEQTILEEMDRIIPTIRSSEKSSSNVIIPTTEELNRLVYLHGAICETLRLYPPVPFEHKQSLERDVLPSGHAIRSNTKILVSLYSMGRMEEIWGEDCMEFKPERWISHKEYKDGKIIYVPSYKFPAFLAGPRTCLGRKIAFTQMKAITCCVLPKFKIEAVDGHPIVPVPAILMFMTYGFKIRVSQKNMPTV